MPCVNPDGTMAPSAISILKATQTAGTVSTADIAAATGLPLYRVRSSLRELVEAGLLREDGARYVLTAAGTARLT